MTMPKVAVNKDSKPDLQIQMFTFLRRWLLNILVIGI